MKLLITGPSSFVVLAFFSPAFVERSTLISPYMPNNMWPRSLISKRLAILFS